MSIAAWGARARCIACIACTAVAAHAQAKAPPRPRLQADRDTNDWRSYYLHGIDRLSRNPDEAADAFYWAMRVDPTVPECYYARGLALLAGDRERFLGFMFGIQSIVESKEVREADSLMHEGMRRNPFMQNKRVFEEALVYVLGQRQFPSPGRTPESQAYYAYNKGQMGLAATKFGVAANDDPKRLSLRVMRANALILGGDGDSAVVELERVLTEMRKRDQKKLVSYYESKALFEYEIGVIQESLGHVDAAREAYGRALTEDLSFHQAHAKLGQLALARGDTTMALAEYEQAAQLRPADGMAHFQYGVTLLRAQRFAEAEVQLRQTVALEPFYAIAHFDLALAIDFQGRKHDAIAPYRAFATLAPRSLDKQIETASDRADTYSAIADPAPVAAKPPGPALSMQPGWRE